MIAHVLICRKSRPEVFCTKGILRNFTKFTGKHLRQSLFLIKLQAWGLKACNFIKKRPQHRCFSVNIAKILFLIEHLLRLLKKLLLKKLLMFLLAKLAEINTCCLKQVFCVRHLVIAAWKGSKYGTFFGPLFHTFRLNMEIYKTEPENFDNCFCIIFDRYN